MSTRNTSGVKNSFHVLTNVNTATVARAGLKSGTMILRKIVRCDAPSHQPGVRGFSAVGLANATS
jgi:hypothetical protein